ncbi:unnamed protein product [Protopolystoma xenopodis]|uniref:Uncharacterized protein n=1 Tax=Protopolystoma xenopodis TaxID=117903 RepID=A0A3S5B4T7_9PLAT|nr:unnamed protein product [Protopolystoma xenopodis]
MFRGYRHSYSPAHHHQMPSPQPGLEPYFFWEWLPKLRPSASWFSGSFDPSVIHQRSEQCPLREGFVFEAARSGCKKMPGASGHVQ